MKEETLKPLCVYVHIPFCLSKCAYCDFLSFSYKDCTACGDRAKYVDALCLEIGNSAKKLAGYCVSTIYFGGGTPTVLEIDEIEKITKRLQTHYKIDKNAEITIEANPETCDFEKLEALCKMGFNRISFGVQSWNDKLLKRLGREHTAQTAKQAISDARLAGFDNISIDLMFALPGQSIEDWRQTLDKTIVFLPEHISCYGLTVEDGTPMSLESGLVLPSDEEDRKMYSVAKEILEHAGYIHYEISNFSKENRHSRHNTNYWTGGDYIGFGLGAHSFIDGKRFSNIDNFDEYNCSCFENGYTEIDPCKLTRRECIEEFVILGLRLRAGICEREFAARFGEDIMTVFSAQVQKYVSQGLICRGNGRIFLTDGGINISNKIFVDFLQ